MGHVVRGRGTDSAVCHELLARYSGEAVRAAGVPAELVLEVESAFLSFGTQQEKYKPFLLLMGRPTALRGEFPCGIEEIGYTATQDRSLMVYRYDLSRRNLKAMVGKGLYEPEFKVPEIIQNNEFRLPCRATCVCFPAAVRNGEAEPPLGFASIEADSCVCDDATSGYDISDYFEEVPERGREFEAEDEAVHADQRSLGSAEYDRGVADAVRELTGEMGMDVLQDGAGAAARDVPEARRQTGDRSVSDLPDIPDDEDDREYI